MFKKIFSAVLALVMATGVFAMSASATNEVVYGDMNNDANINASDALSVLQMSTGIVTATDYQLAIGDINADGKTNSTDALLILQYATGIVTSFDKDYSKTLKAQKVDSVFANDAFTFEIAMYDESVGNFDMVFSTDGSSKVITTVMLFHQLVPIEVRLLNKDGKNYQVLAAIEIEMFGKKERVEGTGTYCETEEDVAKLFDDYVRIFTSEAVYGSTTETAFGGKEYTCETFYAETGAKFEYFFNNGELDYLTVTNNGKVQNFDIENLENGADTNRLVIPSDYTEDSSLMS